MTLGRGLPSPRTRPAAMPAFLSDDWAQALCAALNASPAYAEAAATWEGDLCFVARAGGAPDGSRLDADCTAYFDLDRGACRGAGAVASAADAGPAFAIEAAYADWRAILGGQLDPIMAVMLGKLRVAGDKSVVLRHAKAAKAMVACAASVETEWPAATVL